jgi:hypothetical protein
MVYRKIIWITIAVLAALFLLAGCSKESDSADAVTTASIVNTKEDFLRAAGTDGTWIVAILEDMEFDRQVVIDGTFTRNDEVYRKLAFYSQDENRKVTARYTLTAPSMLVRSPNTRIQGGVFKGDVYVEAEGFHLVDAKVEGNILFASQEYLDSFSADENSEVSGTIGLD